MPRISPTAEGFRAAFRRPLLTFAEITWRWVFGATATILFCFGLFEFLDTLPLTNGEILLLRTRNPFLVSRAIPQILRGSMNRALLSLTLAVVFLAVVWMVAASLGRIATVEAMLEYFRARFNADIPHDDDKGATVKITKPGRFTSLLRLNFLRVAVVLAAIVGFAGAAVVVAFNSSPSHPRPALAFLLFVPVTSLVGLIGYELNWLLSLAAVFVVRDGDDAVGSIASAVALCRERTGAILAVGSWTGVAHLITFAGASTVAGFPIGLMGVLPWRVVALVVILVTLAYLVVADWLYTVRLAGYVCIAEMPDTLLAPPQPPIMPTPPIPAETIDRDELILSDAPNLLVQT
jgi:hypothetical protein